jgi:hypothetical protein
VSAMPTVSDPAAARLEACHRGIRRTTTRAAQTQRLAVAPAVCIASPVTDKRR